MVDRQLPGALSAGQGAKPVNGSRAAHRIGIAKGQAQFLLKPCLRLRHGFKLIESASECTDFRSEWDTSRNGGCR